MKKSLRAIITLAVLASSLLLSMPMAMAQTAESFAMDPVTITNNLASIKVTITSADASSQYDMQVGQPSVDGSGGCTPDPAVAPSPFVNPASGTAVLSYAASVNPITTYCVAIQKRAIGVGLPNVVYTFTQTFSAATNSVTPASSTASGVCNANGCCSNGTDSYCALAPLPGVGDATGKVSFTSCVVNGATVQGAGFGCYVNSIIKIIIGLVGVFAVIMLIVAGIEIMTTASGGEKLAGKSRAMNALFGLLLAVGAYTILNTINPNLVNLTVQIPQADLTFEPHINRTSVTAAQYTTATGKPLLTPSQYTEDANTVSDQLGIPRCALLTTLTYESAGDPGAIGADEDVSNASIRSRRAFIASGKMYSGAPIPAGSTAASSVVNDDSQDFAGAKLQLDGRFSYGIGLLQVTVFPDVWNSDGYDTNPPDWATYKDKELTANILGTTYTPEQLIDSQTNLRVGAELWQHYYQQCNQDIPGTWSAYATGSCNSKNAFAVAQATARTATYNNCVAQGLNNK